MKFNLFVLFIYRTLQRTMEHVVYVAIPMMALMRTIKAGFTTPELLYGIIRPIYGK
jgi:thiamine transporter ThiT